MAVPNDGSFLERFQRGELTSDPMGNVGNSHVATVTIDSQLPALLQACSLLQQRTDELTEEQKQYYLQYLHVYGYPFDPNNPFQHMQPQINSMIMQQQQQQQPFQQPFVPNGNGMGGPNGNFRPPRPVVEETPSTVVWLGSLSPETVDEDILRLANSMSRVTHLKLIAHKGFAFVHFATIDDARIVYEKFQGAVIKGSQIRVGWGRNVPPPDESGGAGGGHGGSRVPPQHDDVAPSPNLWVGNVPQDCTPDIIHQVFSRCGDVLRVRILATKNCAFVTFRNLEDAIRARTELHGYQMGSASLRINYGRPENREETGRAAYSFVNGPASGGPASGPPAVVPTDPPRDEAVRTLIEKFAAKVGGSASGEAFLGVILEKHGNDPQFSFLNPTDPHNGYYKWLVLKHKDPAGAERAAKEHERLMQQLSLPPTAGAAGGSLPPPPPAEVPRQSRFGVGPPGSQQQQHQQQQPQQNFNAVAPPPQLQHGVTSAMPARHASGLFAADAEELTRIVAQLQPTKESIRDAKDWIMMRAAGGNHIADFLAHFAMPTAPDADARQNLVFLVNDVLHHCARQRPSPASLDELSMMFFGHLSDLLRVPFSQSPAEAQMVTQIVDIWRQKMIYNTQQLAMLEQSLSAPPPPPTNQHDHNNGAANGFLDRLAGEMQQQQQQQQQHHHTGKRSAPSDFGDSHVHNRGRFGYE